MSLPPALVTAALVGTGRSGLPAAADLPPFLAALRAEMAARPPEETLLLLAGAGAFHEAAGRLPERVPAAEWHLPAYRAEGDLRPCAPAAERLLERMLADRDVEFLPELLALLEKAGARAPDRLLPEVLARGVKIPRLRPSLLPVIGERGRWLAALNPAWRYAAVDLADFEQLRAVWNDDPGGRPYLATAVRRRDPAAARRLIESTWRAESEIIRRDLLPVLETGLSMADEPFLERALDDRDAHVRRRAADLLAHLPESRLVARMTAAAGDILSLHDDVLKPSAQRPVTDAMVRDGANRDKEPGGVRTATEWSTLLLRTVGAVPLTHWEARFGLSPEALVAASLAGKWPRTLLNAFATAALRQRDMRWIDPLLEGDQYTERTGMLVATLTPGVCYARLATLIDAGRNESVSVFLRRWPGVWDESSGRALLALFARYCADPVDARLNLTLRFLSRQFAQRCPPSLAREAADLLQGRAVNRAWEASLNYLLRTLALRRELWGATIGERSPEEND